MTKVIRFLSIIIVLYFALAAFFAIKPHAISKDAIDNATSAYYVWQKGEFTYDGEMLTYEREPLPIYLTAFYVRFFTDIPKNVSLENFYQSATYTKQILTINAVYSCCLVLLIAWFGFKLTRSWLAMIIVVMSTWFFFLANHKHLNNLYTEILAAFLVTLIAVMAYLLIAKLSKKFAFGLGVALGLFALTKAIGLYVSVMVISLMAIPLFMKNQTSKHICKVQLLITIAFILTISPWMVRNYIQFGDLAIAQRGGIVLLVRALKNNMTTNEYIGGFYVYAPEKLREHMSNFLGFNPRSLDQGGEYQRLIRRKLGDADWGAEIMAQPERATSYFSKAFAIQQTVRLNLFKQKHPGINFLTENDLMLIHQGRADFSMMKADKEVKLLAIKLIRQNFLNHLKGTVLFAWRGLWSFNQGAWALNALAFVALLSLPVVAIKQKQPEVLAASLFGVLLFTFYAFFTHFLPRYSAPLIPLSVLSLAYVAITLLRRCTSKSR